MNIKTEEMMIKRTLFFLFLIWLICNSLLVGCSSIATVENIPSTPVLATSEIPNPQASANTFTKPTITTTISSQPTSTRLALTPTPLPTDTPPSSTTTTPTPLPITCSNWQGPIPNQGGEGLEGTIGLVRLSDAQSELDQQWILLGGDSLQQRGLLPYENTSIIGFSPSGDWFAYQEYPIDPPISPPLPTLYLLSVKGEAISTPIPVQPEDINGNWDSKWITNDLMLFRYFPASHPQETWQFGSFIVFNPFTGERRDDLLNNLPYWSGNTTVYFSPDMTRVAYVSDFQSEIGTSMVLWDIEQQEIVWMKEGLPEDSFYEEFLGYRGFYETFIWSPDSSGFVFTIWEQPERRTYLVDRDGKQETILVNIPDQNRGGDVIQGGLWSPDGRFIYYFNGWTNTSLLYDTVLNQKTEMCIETALNVAWSPDSSRIAYSQTINEQPHLFALNVYTGEVTYINKIHSFVPFAWLENETWLIPLE